MRIDVQMDAYTDTNFSDTVPEFWEVLKSGAPVEVVIAGRSFKCLFVEMQTTGTTAHCALMGIREVVVKPPRAPRG